MSVMAKEVLQMSVMASWVVLIVLAVRLCIRRLPKKFSYVLWGIVLVRFLCPVYMKSPVSLVSPVELGQPVLRVLETDTAMVRFGALERFSVWAAIWVIGMLVFLCVHLYSYSRLKKRLMTAVMAEDGVYETDRISGAFVLGVRKPCIYMETGMEEGERDIILLHERVHIERKDHLVKLLAYGVLAVHWFNPLAWISVWMMCEDMEMSCDEAVAERTEIEAYSAALLSVSARRSGLKLPLAFGESRTKSRIKNILCYRRPKAWMRGGVVLMLGVLGVVLLTNSSSAARSVSVIGGADGSSSIFWAGKLGEGEQPEDVVVKTVKKNYESLEAVPEGVYYEEYIDGSWWSGELMCVGEPVEISSVGLYEAEFFGMLMRQE